MNSHIVRVALLCLAAAIAAPLHAAEQPDKDAWLKGRLFGPELVLKHQSKLKLSEKQRDAIGELRQGAKPGRQAIDARRGRPQTGQQAGPRRIA